MKTKKQQAIINALAVVALVAGGFFTVADGIMTIFDGSQAAQYLYNYIYILGIMPASISVTNLYEWLHPENEETNA